jgi:hypothetical protein
VLPRSEKFFLKRRGQVRQYRSVSTDKAKAARLAARDREPSCVRGRGGKGEVYRTMLFVKLLCLFANKFASLDADGVGVEMEADKPSWYDALNGLPGLCGSSLPETFELKRLALFLIQAIEEQGAGGAVPVPAELRDFLRKLELALAARFRRKTGDFGFWDAASRAKEAFRAATFEGLSGRDAALPLTVAKAFLEHAREKIEMGLDKAWDRESGLYPTYFENEVTRYRPLKTPPAADGAAALPRVQPLAFRRRALPWFLEAPVHALKVEKDPERRKALVKAVRRSALYDAKLGMYKVNAPLAPASLEIGRARVFKPGWLENESVWLHMEYKFLLELLRSGMTEEFYKDFWKALVPFQPAERYGRSPLENSSFIVSSAFSGPALHGAGFVARLSGSTAEFLNLWLIMAVGKRPFVTGHDGKVSLRLEPHLPAALFTRQETSRMLTGLDGAETRVRVPAKAIAFLFLGKTLLVYHNPKELDTFGKTRVTVRKIAVTRRDGRRSEWRGDSVPSPHALEIRDGFVPRIDAELG